MPSSAHSARRRLTVVGMAGLVGHAVRVERHRIVTTGMERMAARQAPDRQPAATQAAVPLHRLECVLRTRRVEAAACAEQWADRALVGADQDADQVAHVEAIFCQRVSRAARRRALSAVSTPARAPITMSSGGRLGWLPIIL